VRRVLAAVLLTACGPAPRWVVVEVRSAGAPVAAATVAAVCRPLGSAAELTGSDGGAALAIRDRADACAVTAGRDGLRTARRADVTPCAERASCRPVVIELGAR
jgi:hypothetical protein